MVTRDKMGPMGDPYWRENIKDYDKVWMVDSQGAMSC
jgi:hypothetical protein